MFYLLSGFPKLLNSFGSIFFLSASCLFCNSSVFLFMSLLCVAAIGYELQLFKNVTAKSISVKKENFFINFFKLKYIDSSKIQKPQRKFSEVYFIIFKQLVVKIPCPATDYIFLLYLPPTSNKALVICPSEQYFTASIMTSNKFC